MNDLRKAAEMALEVFEHLSKGESPAITRGELVYEIAALRQALEESANSTTDFVEPKALAQPPCQTGSQCIGGKCLECEREWVGLTESEIDGLIASATYMDETSLLDVVNLAEAKLKEKNT